jgi:hypothetical protein
MAPGVAQAAEDSLDALLPTPTIVDAIETAARASGRLVPFDAWARWGDDSQLETSTILWREANIARRLAEDPPAPGTLLAGHLKDTVIAPYMPAGKVVIYGGRYPRDSRVQPMYSGHGDWWDGGYSQGIRAVRRQCTLNGAPALLDDILQSGALGGPVARLRYPTAAIDLHDTIPAPRSTPTISAVLRRGHSGPAVIELQKLLARASLATQIDGIFGADTERCVRAFQAAHPPLAVDGAAGPRTLTALRAIGDSDHPTAIVHSDREILAFADMPRVLSDAEVDALFGPLLWKLAPTATERGAIKILNDWQSKNLRKVAIPQLRGVPWAPASGEIFLHRLIVEQTRAMFAAWEKDGDLPLLLSWAGTWNPRVVRGYEDSATPLLSRHSYATAMDINAAWNPFHGPAAKLGQKGTVIPLLYRMREHGFTSLGEHDPMHAEAVVAL